MRGPGRSVFVTGVSSGIGAACAERLGRAGWRVFGSVRRLPDAAAMQTLLGARFTPLLFDVTDGAAVHRAADQVRAALGGRPLGGLINNAGIAGPVSHLPVAEFRHQPEVNVVGPMQVTQAFLPLLSSAPRDWSRRAVLS